MAKKRSKAAINKDRKYLSDQPWEKAYAKKRKKIIRYGKKKARSKPRKAAKRKKASKPKGWLAKIFG